jgi:hypothetical protein
VIARYRVLLPFAIYVVPGELRPHVYQREGYEITIYPPISAGQPNISEIVSRQQQPTEKVKVSGQATVQANALQIDFKRANFRRNREDPENLNEPSSAFMCSVVNDWVLRMRSVSQAPQLKPIPCVPSVLEYLSDDGGELQKDETLVRKRFVGVHRVQVHIFDAALWDETSHLSEDFRPAVYDTLLLDAFSILPEIGSALVLGFAALETCIESSLSHFAQEAGLPQGLWGWITERDDFRKQPSVQFDQLMKVLVGKSLKEEPKLWEGFVDLKKARNSFVHTGRALLNDAELDAAMTETLLVNASHVINWVEGYLPQGLRRPKTKRKFDIELAVF